MKWRWEQFGYQEGPSPGQLVEAELQKLHGPGVRVVAAARDADVLMVVVDGLPPSAQVFTSPAVIDRIRSELGLAALRLVRWSDDPAVLVASCCQPIQVQQVFLCDMLGRAITLVAEEQLPLATRRTEHLASKICGWDVEVTTAERLEQKIDGAAKGFQTIEHVTDNLAQGLVEQGYLSYDDLSVIEPDALMDLGGLTVEQADAIIEEAKRRALDENRGQDRIN